MSFQKIWFQWREVMDHGWVAEQTLMVGPETTEGLLRDEDEAWEKVQRATVRSELYRAVPDGGVVGWRMGIDAHIADERFLYDVSGLAAEYAYLGPERARATVIQPAVYLEQTQRSGIVEGTPGVRVDAMLTDEGYQAMAVDPRFSLRVEPRSGTRLVAAVGRYSQFPELREVSRSSDGGPLDLSQIDDVRVVGMVARPPEVSPREQVEFSVHVANPEDRPVEVAVWGCTNLGAGCAETALGPVADWAAVATLERGKVEVRRTVPSELGDVIGQYVSEFPARTWALACEEGLCPIIAELGDAVESGDSANPALAAALADPTEFMSDLPFDGVSLAARSFLVSLRSSEERNHNPTFEPRFVGYDLETLEVDRGTAAELAFWVYDPDGDTVLAYAYTTIGRIEDRREKVTAGAVRFYLLADGGAGEGEVFVFFDDGTGGGAFWSMPIRVR